MSQYPATIALSGLDGANGFRINGEALGDSAGWSVSDAGDVNGDGFADLIVGAPSAAYDGSQAGASYLVFGKASGFGATLNLANLSPVKGYRFYGNTDGDKFGRSVSSAGDVNGDGFDDLLIGAPHETSGGAVAGASYVIFGGKANLAALDAAGNGTDDNILMGDLDGNNGFKLSGVDLLDYSGVSVSDAGDINGDGFGDLIVGAPRASPAGSDPYSGAAYVVFGAASGFAPNLSLSSLDGTNGFRVRFAHESGNPYSQSSFGRSVSSAGDINGDGYDDLVIGARAIGQVYVVFGKPSPFNASVVIQTLDGTNGFVISNAAYSESTGFSVSSAGDVNGDGFADLIVGSPKAFSNYEGSAVVVFGGATFDDGYNLAALADGVRGFEIYGAAGYYLGAAVSSAGDVNGDGFDDILVGAKYANLNGYNSGATFVVFGKASAFDPFISFSALDGKNGFKLYGEEINDLNGYSVSAAGDVNGDGFADLMVGTPGANGDTGASYVVFGRMPDTAVVRTGTQASQTLAGGNFDDTLSGVSGDDKLYGNGGDDELHGGDGNDTLNSGTGDDFARAGSGNDVAYAGAGDDTVRGGSGIDSLWGGNDIDDISGGSGNDTLNGDAGSDLLDGGSGDDKLNGGDGNDVLRGADGKDTLNGGAGSDRIAGGDGQDTLDGATGADQFRYDLVADSTGNTYDIVRSFDFSLDVFDMPAAVTGIDTTIATGTLSKTNFDANLAVAANAAHLHAKHAVLFTPNAGNLAGKTFLVIDANGIAGYQAAADLVVRLDDAVNQASIGTEDFI